MQVNRLQCRQKFVKIITMERVRMRNLTIRIDEQTYKTLTELAKADNRTLSSMVRLILKKGTVNATGSNRIAGGNRKDT